MTLVPDPALLVAFRALVAGMLESVAAAEILNPPGCWGRHAHYSRADGAVLDVAERAALEQAHHDGLIATGLPDAGRYRPLQLTPAGWQYLTEVWEATARPPAGTDWADLDF